MSSTTCCCLQWQSACCKPSKRGKSFGVCTSQETECLEFAPVLKVNLIEGCLQYYVKCLVVHIELYTVVLHRREDVLSSRREQPLHHQRGVLHSKHIQ